jgi:hypothetical protein
MSKVRLIRGSPGTKADFISASATRRGDQPTGLARSLSAADLYRSHGSQPQSESKSGRSLEELRHLLNVDDCGWTLT